MKILLTMNVPYTRVYGGANKSNRSLAEGLAARGHSIQVVAPALATPSTMTHEEFVEEMRQEGISIEFNKEAYVVHLNRVELHAVIESSQLRGYLIERLRRFDPDWVIVTSEDPSQNLLDAALKTCPSRVVYIAHTPQMFPFGPAGLYPGQARTDLVRQSAAIVAISRYVADYITQWTGRDVFVNHTPHYGSGPFPNLARFDEGYVLLMNACAVKGITIFLALAREFPEVQFAALPGYGTTAEDQRALQSLDNITILKNRKHLDDILCQTRILLMPSLWAEGFGMAVVDAMLRGIPVLASDCGGLAEAKLGTDYLLPVRPIERFADQLDDKMLPVAVIPEQDITPWRAGLSALLSDCALYERQSAAGRAAALKFISGLSIEPFETLLIQLGAKSRSGSKPHLGAEMKIYSQSSTVADLTPEQRALLMLRLRKNASHRASAEEPLSAVQAQPRGGNRSLSFAQQRLWFIDRLEPGSPLYNCPAAIRLTGKLNPQALEQTLDHILQRHDVLRASFEADAWGTSHVLSPASLSLAIADLSKLPEAEQGIAAQRLAFAEARRPFQLSAGPLFRATLLHLHDEDHILLITIHHIVTDAWSTGIFLQEIQTLYAAYGAGVRSPLPELPIQYADFAEWQRQYLQGETLERLLSYWKKQLGGNLPVLGLPSDRPRPAIQSISGARATLTLSEDLNATLKALSRQQGGTLFMTLLAAFLVWLYRYTGQEDLVVGTPIANRNRREIESLIGFFVNTLALRVDLSGNPSFVELLRRVSKVALEAYDHQEVPFEKLVEALEPERDRGHTPLFQVMFILHDAPRSTFELPGLRLSTVEVDTGTSKFDLTLEIIDTGQTLDMAFEYTTDLFDADTIARMLEQFKTLVAGIATDPQRRLSDLPLLTAQARRQLLWEFNATRITYSRSLLVHERFEQQVEQTPDAMAVFFEGEQLSYEELNGRANRLAHHLRSLGVRPDTLVGIYMERSIEMVIAVLGIFKAGGGYLPLDPAYPKERLAFMLEECQSPVLLTQQHLLDDLPRHQARVICMDSDWQEIARQSSANLESGVTGENIAYAIYTSGSTGKPKGVTLPQRALMNLLEWHLATLRIGARTLQFASLSFDASFHEIFAALFSGGTLFVVTESLRRDTAALARFLVEHAVEKVVLPVVVFQQLAKEFCDHDYDFANLKEITTTGEQLQITKSVIEWFQHLEESATDSCALHNHYGPSESHVATAFTLQPPASRWPMYPSIGRPLYNTQIHIIDKYFNLSPLGAVGELLIGGDNLARGYLHRPDLTAEKFVPNPFADEPGSRLYRTADLARFLSNGDLEFLGRMDHQVKIRGFRVELGEIETVLCEHPDVQEAIVRSRDLAPGDKRLIAYIICKPGTAPGDSELHRFLKQTLPDYMIPATFMFLAAFPLTTNGKVDARALPEPDSIRPGLESTFVAPRTPVEEKLAQIWCEVLKLDRVGINDSFFELGGHSLLMIQIVSRVWDSLHIDLPLKDFFQTPTVAGQALAITEIWAKESGSDGLSGMLDQLDQLSADQLKELLLRSTQNG